MSIQALCLDYFGVLSAADGDELVGYLGQVTRAQPGLRLFVFSNSGASLRERIARRGLDDMFEGYALSSEVGALKPAPEFFERALSQWGLEAAQAVLIDDQKANCMAAESAGMVGILYSGVEELAQRLDHLGVRAHA